MSIPASCSMLRHAFHDLGLHRVYLFTLADNHGALEEWSRFVTTLFISAPGLNLCSRRQSSSL